MVPFIEIQYIIPDRQSSYLIFAANSSYSVHFIRLHMCHGPFMRENFSLAFNFRNALSPVSSFWLLGQYVRVVIRYNSSYHTSQNSKSEP